MEDKNGNLTFSLAVDAPADIVYEAFTNPIALERWFADVVEADPRPGGRFYAWWQAGFYASGIFKEAEKDRRVMFTWHAVGEPAPTTVEVRIESQGQGSLVALVHAGLGEGEAWDHVRANFLREWPVSFTNLQSILEKGVDLRQFNRPMLGFYIGGINDKDKATQLGVPVEKGVIVADVIANMGAQKAGLTGNDVIVSLDGKDIPDLNVLGQTIGSYKGGDRVKMGIYRGAEHLLLEVELAKRPIPDFPPPPTELAEILQAIYSKYADEQKAILADVTEEEANAKPAPSEWSAKETLIHLLASERWTHMTEENALSGTRQAGYPSVDLLMTAILETTSLPDLIAELRRAEAQTVAMLKAYPDKLVARKWQYFALHANPHELEVHLRGHAEQIKAAIAAAREGTPG